MVASRELENPYKRGVRRKKGRGFGALAQIVGRTAIPFLRKFIVPAAKHIGADMLEFAVPEIGEVIGCIKSFESAAKSVGKQTLEKELDSGSKQREINPTKTTKQSSRSQETFWQTFLVHHIRQQFAVPTFWGIVGKSRRKNPKSFLALNFKLVKGRGYDTCESKEKKNEPKN